MTSKWSLRDPPPRQVQEEKAWVAEHDVPALQLHPDLKVAYEAYKRAGYAGSIYDYLPGSYRNPGK